MTKTEQARRERLMPNGIPRWIRCYDDGGGADRYTVVYTGLYHNRGKHGRGGCGGCGGMRGIRPHYYVGMSEQPFHPQGIASHEESLYKAIDVNISGFAPAIGRKCHLGKRIMFLDLPKDCQTLVLSDYREIWSIS